MLTWLANAVGRAGSAVSSAVTGWVHAVIAGVYSFLHSIFGDVRGAWRDFVTGALLLRNALDDFGSEVARGFELLFEKWIPGIIKWVTNTVYKLALDAWHWITTDGAKIYYYITHPAALVDLIFDALLAEIENTAWDTAEKLGSFSVALIWKNLPKFLALIEDILDAIL